MNWWRLGCCASVAMILTQALINPQANIFSLRDDKFQIIDRIAGNRDVPWPDNNGGIPEILAPTFNCGFSVDVDYLLKHADAVGYSVRNSAEIFYRGDLRYYITENLSGWQVRLWQLRYAFGLWSGRMDDGPVPAKEVEEARSFARFYYRKTVEQLECDIARGATAIGAARPK